jgi:hypothetical protein
MRDMLHKIRFLRLEFVSNYPRFDFELWLRRFLYQNFSHLGAFDCEKLTLSNSGLSFGYRSAGERIHDEYTTCVCVEGVAILCVQTQVFLGNGLFFNSPKKRLLMGRDKVISLEARLHQRFWGERSKALEILRSEAWGLGRRRRRAREVRPADPLEQCQTGALLKSVALEEKRAPRACECISGISGVFLIDPMIRILRWGSGFADRATPGWPPSAEAGSFKVGIGYWGHRGAESKRGIDRRYDF